MRRISLFLVTALAAFLVPMGLAAGAEIGVCKRSDCPVPPLCVVDGDTIRASGQDWRLLGFNTPELRGACKDESELGAKARDRLVHLLNRATSIRRAVPIDKEPKDRYGRELVRLYIDGVDLAVILIREGLAVDYEGGKRDSAIWCPQEGGD